MRRHAAWLAVALLGCAAVGARAATVDDLYTAATPVGNQSQTVRKAAFARDLAAVFVKVSGDPAAPESAALAPILAQADGLVVEFRYQPAPGKANAGLELWARFDAKSVDTALTGAGLAIWGRERPAVLAWVLAPGGILGDDPGNPVAAAMLHAADARGLPVELPLMDVTDQQRVSAFDIRTQFMPALASAAKRYGTRAMLVGTIRRSGAGVASDWSLQFGGAQTPFSATAATPAAAASAAVGQAATLLARQLAFAPGSGGLTSAVVVVVDGVDSLAAEVKVQRLIAGVPGVQAPRLIGIDGRVVRFRVEYAGAASGLARALSLSSSLTEAASAAQSAAPGSRAAAQSAGPTLEFRYTP